MTTHNPNQRDTAKSRPALGAIKPDAINGFVLANAKNPHYSIPYTW